jgi:hypothetical protein
MQNKVAVLTGDIVDSSKLKVTQRKYLIENLNFFFQKFTTKSKNELKLKIKFEIYRGDSFQGYLENPEHALRIALLMRCYLKSEKNFPNKSYKLDTRIAIGIGKVSYKGNALSESDGEVFRYSGRLLDGMKKMPQKIAIQTSWESINIELNNYLQLLEAIISKWTSLQADAIYYKLLGYSEVAIAEILDIKQPAVNQRAKTASWSTIELVITRYENLIKSKL